ncbi:MAG: HPr kinase/phosphorylase [Beijerinckiaceae bacterium]
MAPESIIHGCAIAVGGRGLLVLGDSSAGKSSLLARMLADWPFGKVRLVADDRVKLVRHGKQIVARPHAAIVGQFEIRGYGIMQMEPLEAVVIHGVIKIAPTPLSRLPEPDELFTSVSGQRLPCITLSTSPDPFQRLITIWPFFSDQMAIM